MDEERETVGHEKGDSRPVLVFGSDPTAFLGTVRSLGRAGIAVHAAGCRADEPAGRSPAHHRLPPYTGDGEAWLATVRELVERYDYALLVPTSDSSLAQLDRHRDALGEGRLAIASPAALSVLIDKYATRTLARQLGIPVAYGRALGKDDSATALADEFGLPVIIKSVRSHRPGEAVQKTPVFLCASEREVSRVLAKGGDLIAERFLPGYGRGVSVIAFEGKVLQAVQHRRLRQEHDTGPSSWRISEKLDPRLLDAVRRIVSETGYTGIAMFEFRFSTVGGEWILLEVNPRAWGSLHLAMAAGADFPRLQHAMLVKGQIPPERFDFTTGVQRRSLWGEFNSVAGLWSDPVPAYRKLARLAGFLFDLSFSRSFDSRAEDDPAPFSALRREVLRRLFARLGKTLGWA